MAAHRYWRFFIVRSSHAGAIAIAELALRSSVGGSNLIGSGTISASNSVNGNVPSRAADGNTSTFWETTATNQWWAYDFGEGVEYDVVEFTMTSRASYQTTTPRDFRIEYSDNGTDWTPSTWYLNYTWGATETKTFTVSVYDDFAPHDLTSNTSHSPFVSSASAEAFGTYGAWKAFMGNVAADSYKWVGGAPAAWLQLDIGSGNSKKLINYTVQVKGDAAGEPPKDWTMKGSNNGSGWDTLDTVTNQTGWAAHEQRSFTCDVQTSGYRYFRLDITANNGDANYTSVEQLYLFGEDPGSTPTTSQPIMMAIC